MPEYNADRIRQIMGEINNALRKLAVYAEMSEDEFLAHAEKIDSSKYNLIVAIEGAIDICNSIAARAGGRAPRNHADCFAVLGELEFLDDGFVDRLKKMARFRNLLVHLYWKVDDKKIHQIIKTDILDIKDFLRAVTRIIG